jgi:hypothetical protein
VREFLWLRASERQDGEYDGHRALLRLKAAALLGCLRTGRPVVGRADWAAAGQVLDTPDAVRDWPVAWLGDTDEQQREARLSFAEERAAREAQGRLSAESDHTRVRNVLLRAHKKHSQLKANALVKRTGRDYRIARAVLPGLIAQGLVSWPDADDADGEDG